MVGADGPEGKIKEGYLKYLYYEIIYLLNAIN